uniref:BHLH domain-containing protein n=1 Tax=Kalanchoe fedtschenkoi TaxID=63787 RepID=A0A7N0T2A3_KALFE
MVNSQADVSGEIPMEAAFDDLQHSNSLYAYQLPTVETAMNDFQINNNPTEQFTTNIRGSYDISTTSYSDAADAAIYLYSSVNPTGVAWPEQENHCYNNNCPSQFTNGDYPVWNENYASTPGREVKGKATNAIGATTSRSSEVQDHIMAERNRREKLNQRFIALSSVVPGLKKMDKATVLEDATKYVKQLQEQIKTLQKQTKSRTMIESAFVVKKTLLVINDDNNMSGFFNETSFIERTLPDESLPEIEVRFCDKKVLVRVHCDSRKKGAAEKILSEIMKLHLTVVNSNIVALGSLALDVTVLAQRNQECSMAEKELVKTLCRALKSII